MKWGKNRHGEVIEVVGEIVLNLSYWDCECHDDFIHTVEELKCVVCGTTQEDSPNSREREIRRLTRPKNLPKMRRQ